MAASSDARRLFVVPNEASSQVASASAATIAPVCPVCFGTGMEVVAGRGGTPL
jgi:hypothetical protein